MVIVVIRKTEVSQESEQTEEEKDIRDGTLGNKKI